jgi:DnaJ-class molecular chaperone
MGFWSDKPKIKKRRCPSCKGAGSRTDALYQPVRGHHGRGNYVGDIKTWCQLCHGSGNVPA